jgi:hypothetical protein
LLKKISEQEGVVEITGEDDTGSWAASHEHMRHDDEKNYLHSRTTLLVSTSKGTSVGVETIIR